MRFDYAWRFFELHARQRQLNLQVSVAFLAIVYAAVGICLQFRLGQPLAVVGLFGAACCPLYFAMDRRNRSLVKIAEGDLLEIEEKLFSVSRSESSRLIRLSNERSSNPLTYSSIVAAFFLLNFAVLSYFTTCGLAFGYGVRLPGALDRFICTCSL